MPTRSEIEAIVIVAVIGIVIIALSLTVLHFRNPQIEAQCIAKGGQVLSTPGRISSCLYSNK